MIYCTVCIYIVTSFVFSIVFNLVLPSHISSVRSPTFGHKSVNYWHCCHCHVLSERERERERETIGTTIPRVLWVIKFSILYSVCATDNWIEYDTNWRSCENIRRARYDSRRLCSPVRRPRSQITGLTLEFDSSDFRRSIFISPLG